MNSTTNPFYEYYQEFQDRANDLYKLLSFLENRLEEYKGQFLISKGPSTVGDILTPINSELQVIDLDTNEVVKYGSFNFTWGFEDEIKKTIDENIEHYSAFLLSQIYEEFEKYSCSVTHKCKELGHVWTTNKTTNQINYMLNEIHLIVPTISEKKNSLNEWFNAFIEARRIIIHSNSLLNPKSKSKRFTNKKFIEIRELLSKYYILEELANIGKYKIRIQRKHFEDTAMRLSNFAYLVYKHLSIKYGLELSQIAKFPNIENLKKMIQEKK